MFVGIDQSVKTFKEQVKWITWIIFLQCNALLENLGSWYSGGCHFTCTTHSNTVAECTPPHGCGHTQQDNVPQHRGTTAQEWPWEWDEELNLTWPNCTNPNLIEHLWDVPERVLSIEAPPWIRLGADPPRLENRTPGFVLWPLAPEHWILWFAGRSLAGRSIWGDS